MTMNSTTRSTWRTLRQSTAGVVLLACVAAPAPAAAQTMTDVLSFLLINRSVQTGDFMRDEEAAAATRDTISALLLAERGTLPNSSSSVGFLYRFDPALGASVRSSDSFGPFFTERALTAGRGQVFVGLSYQPARFQTLDGRSLRDGTLVSTASKLRGDTQFFDVETLTLNLSTDTVGLQATAGVTDRLDVGAAVQLVRLGLSGQRIDTYRGTSALQAAASGSAVGPSDTTVRAKYNVYRQAAGAVAIGSDLRLPTGDADNLLGSGQTTFTPRAFFSMEDNRAGVHGNVGYVLGGLTRETDFRAAATLAATSRLTLVLDAAGRRLASLGGLTEITVPHPRLIDVETVRLTGSAEPTTRVVAALGFKWNVWSTWLLSAHVIRPVTRAGLNVRWTPVISLDRAFDE